MLRRSPPKFVIKISEKLENKTIKIELISLFLIFIGLILKLSEINSGNIIIIISMASLSILYYFSAFRPVKSEKNIGILQFINRITFWGYSIALIGILYSLMNYPGSEIMIKVAFSTMIFSLIANTYNIYKNSTKSNSVRQDILRNVIIFVITLIFYITPQQDINKALKNHNKANNEIEIVEK